MEQDKQSIPQVFERLLEDARGAWRFRWHAMAVAWALCIAGWVIVATLPNVYEAGAQIYVDASSRLRPLLQGLAVESNVDAEMGFVRHSLLSRPHLEKLLSIARPGNEDLNAQSRDQMVEMLRNKINLSSGSPSEQQGGRLYTLTYQDKNSERAVLVVESLVKSFMMDIRGSSQSESAEAQQFLNDQIHELEGKLASAEMRLADFKKKHIGLMPGEGGDYFTRLNSERDGLQRAQAALHLLVSQKEELQRQLSGERPQMAVSRPNGGGDALASRSNDLDSRIKDSEARLDDLLLRFTDKHPEVIALRETITQLKSRRAEEMKAISSGGTGSGSLALTENPLYQSIRMQLNKVEVDIASANGDVADRQRRIADLQRLMDTAPDVEAQLARLNRDYGVTKVQYEALLDRLQKARLSEQAEETGIVKLQLINPAAAKPKPVSPNRPILIAAVFFGGIGAALTLAVLLHQLLPVFSSGAALARVTNLPLLGVVSSTNLQGHLTERRMTLVRYCTVVAALAAIFVVAIAFQTRSAELAQLIITGRAT